jgi:hypothetical protein
MLISLKKSSVNETRTFGGKMGVKLDFRKVKRRCGGVEREIFWLLCSFSSWALALLFIKRKICFFYKILAPSWPHFAQKKKRKPNVSRKHRNTKNITRTILSPAPPYHILLSRSPTGNATAPPHHLLLPSRSPITNQLVSFYL